MDDTVSSGSCMGLAWDSHGTRMGIAWESLSTLPSSVTLSGQSVSKEYKVKLRSLVFNLKDVANPDLRARVLQVGSLG